MNPPGALIDTGPLVALISRDDSEHDRARDLLSRCRAPFGTCEPVIAEACYLLRKVHPDAPAELLSLGNSGFFHIALCLSDHWLAVQSLLKKYKKLQISLADACLIRCAEIHREPRILTFDSDFTIYRWDRNKKFDLINQQ